MMSPKKSLLWFKWVIFLSVTFFWVALDQVTKLLILENLGLGQTHQVWPGVLNWTYVGNPGAAFGFLGEMPQNFRETFFYIVPPVAALLVSILVYQTAESQVGTLLALGSIMGGAMGNFIDRLRFQFVVDFIDIHLGNQWAWPAFNLADVAIVGGSFYLVISVLRER
jgi:signal peptidase II